MLHTFAWARASPNEQAQRDAVCEFRGGGVNVLISTDVGAEVGVPRPERAGACAYAGTCNLQFAANWIRHRREPPTCQSAPTACAAQGMDFRRCQLVVSFDAPVTPLAFIQTRRARAPRAWGPSLRVLQAVLP